MKNYILILALLCGAVYATEPAKPIAQTKPVSVADAAKPETLATLAAERDTLKAELATAKDQLAAVIAEANARIQALEAQRNSALNDAVTAQAQLAVMTQKKS